MKNTLVFLLFLCSVTLSSCLSYKEIEMGDVKNVKLNQAPAEGVQVQAEMQVKNPNKYTIKIKRIEADMLVNGKNIGKMTLDKKIVLRRQSDQVQSFAVNTQLTNLISAMPSVLFGGTITLQLKGFIYGKVFLFSKKFPLDEEEKISAKDLDLF